MLEFLKRDGLGYWLIWVFLRPHWFIWHRFRVSGAENVPLSGNGIIASNHLSHLDSPPIGYAVNRRVHYVADEAMFEKPFLKWWLPATGGVKISREGGQGEVMIGDAFDTLNKGKLLVIYPEGTRSRTGYPGRCRTGVIVIAAKTGAPIIPCRLSGTFDCWPYNRVFPKPGPIQVSFGKPIYIDPDNIDLDDRDALMEKADELMESIMSLPGWFPKSCDKDLPE